MFKSRKHFVWVYKINILVEETMQFIQKKHKPEKIYYKI